MRCKKDPIFLPSETFFYFTGASIPLSYHSNCERSELTWSLKIDRGSKKKYLMKNARILYIIGGIII